eukprot:CAMPEP_0203763290 /NCGR_PEP_ID=MMETSP0098-20131031/15973_1 /ASSEMBLY_ACC=CAM_ASM_000208 /TAXON_ID=96639 /ORGANISM=" , Strain NY0313808BC1" /LENGTH=203 /DNA_ID=CAMNT_0050657965 /DNA_START=148 /DNA_END=760 /DNA_ORIENTATION=+
MDNEEDRKLCVAVEAFEKLPRSGNPVGRQRWARISSFVASRNSKQCRDRWNCLTNGFSKRQGWSSVEDQKLIAAQATHGNAWVRIATEFPGRSDNMLKSRFRVLKQTKSNDKREPTGENSMIKEEEDACHEPQPTGMCTVEIPEIETHYNQEIHSVKIQEPCLKLTSEEEPVCVAENEADDLLAFSTFWLHSPKYVQTNSKDV